MHESGQIGQLPVLDPDRSSRPLDKLWGGGGGRGGRSPKNIFSALRASFWSENRGAETPGPSRGSGTGYGTLK